MRRYQIQILAAILCCYLPPSLLLAETGRYRCMWREDPATSIVIGWDQMEGNGPELFYDVIDFGRQVTAYRKSKKPDRLIVAKGMSNRFVRLTGLQPNTVYYFVIKDSDGVSSRMSFKTMPASSAERLSIIAGGDSRNHHAARRSANRLVSKLRPHFVIFDGDMTGGDTGEQWQQWLDDWQYTIGSDGRLFPIVPARGNHEASNASIVELFDLTNKDIYYALTFGGDLLRLYTLNSMIAPGGSQRIWLEGDLKANQQRVIWKMAQYHQSMRPHTKKKQEKNEIYKSWAGLFHKYGVKLVMESDAHVVKVTYPIRPSNVPGSEEGFIQDDETGTVYIGEGCWGAPLRPNDDNKSWTRASGSFNQFKWIFVDRSKIEIRTIRTDNAESVYEVKDQNIFEPPIGLVVWNPPSGDVVTIVNQQQVAQQSTPGNSGSSTGGNNRVNGESPFPTERPNPNDKADWSPFPKVTPNIKGDVVLEYHVRNPGPVNVLLISKDWQKLAELNLDSQPAGNMVKSLNMKQVPAGDYLLVVKNNGVVLRRFHLIKR